MFWRLIGLGTVLFVVIFVTYAFADYYGLEDIKEMARSALGVIAFFTGLILFAFGLKYMVENE